MIHAHVRHGPAAVARVPRTIAGRWGTALLLAAMAPALHAQNAIPNPQFDTQLAPWAPFTSSAPDPVGVGAAPLWVATPDITGNPASGSAQVSLDGVAMATNAASGIAQCVEFDSPTLVNYIYYGMSFRVPPTMATDGSMSVTVEMRLFENADCSGFITGGSQGQVLGPVFAGDTAWYRLSDHGFNVPDAPALAASAQIRGYLRRTDGAATQAAYALNVDHFVLALNSSTPVGLMHFDVE